MFPFTPPTGLKPAAIENPRLCRRPPVGTQHDASDGCFVKQIRNWLNLALWRKYFFLVREKIFSHEGHISLSWEKFYRAFLEYRWYYNEYLLNIASQACEVSFVASWNYICGFTKLYSWRDCGERVGLLRAKTNAPTTNECCRGIANIIRGITSLT